MPCFHSPLVTSKNGPVPKCLSGYSTGSCNFPVASRILGGPSALKRPFPEFLVMQRKTLVLRYFLLVYMRKTARLFRFIVPPRKNLDLPLLMQNLYYTGGITPKRVTSGGAHLHYLAPGQNSYEKSSQRRRAVGDIVSDATSRGIEWNYRNVSDIFYDYTSTKDADINLHFPFRSSNNIISCINISLFTGNRGDMNSISYS